MHALLFISNLNYNEENTIFSFLLSFLSLSLSAFADEEEQALVLHLKDGSQVTYFLSSRPKLSFDAGMLKLATSQVEVSYPVTNLKRYTFEMKDLTAIVGVGNTGQMIRIEDNEVRFSGFASGELLEVYAADGRKVASSSVGANGNAIVSLQDLPAGVYMVHHGLTTYKIVKK